MTDSTGIFQFADHGIPNFAEGYCTDDVARALLLTVLLEELGLDSPAVERSATTYASFLQFAFNPERMRFRNFLSFDRRWGEDMGSDDCQGRAVWALGACLGRSKRRGLQFWAAEHFEQAVTAIAAMTAPRAWALGLLGIREYRRRLEGDRLIGQIRATLTNRLLDLFDRTATVEWPWFEGVLAYDNARLPQALIASGGDRALATGLRALRWLVGVQKSPRGDFRPIGSNGFYRKGANRPSSISSRSRRRRPSPPAWRLTAPLGTRPGWGRPKPPSPGSSAATTWGWRSTTRSPAAAATGCSRTAST